MGAPYSNNERNNNSDNQFHFQERELLGVIILSILTCGLYSFYWAYTTYNGNASFVDEKIKRNKGKLAILIFGLIVFYLIANFTSIFDAGVFVFFRIAIFLVVLYLEISYLKTIYYVGKVVNKPLLLIAILLMCVTSFGVTTIIAQYFINEYERDLAYRNARKRDAQRRQESNDFGTSNYSAGSYNNQMDSNTKIDKEAPTTNNTQKDFTTQDDIKEDTEQIEIDPNIFLETKTKYIDEVEEIFNAIDKTRYSLAELRKLQENKDKFDLDIAKVVHNPKCLDELNTIRADFFKAFNYENSTKKQSDYQNFVRQSLLRLEKIYNSINLYTNDIDQNYLKCRQEIKRVSENDQYEYIINEIISKFEESTKRIRYDK